MFPPPFLFIAALTLGPPPAPADSECVLTAADPSLYCIPLIPTATAPAATGSAVLAPVPGPFGVSVTRDGRLEFSVVLELAGLPAPRTLGAYRSYVAWATTPDLDPMIRLGPVGNGRRELGPISLEKFIIMVSAERDTNVARRTGPLVLRGGSPSLLMIPHGVTALPPQAAAKQGHGAPDHDGGWIMPPMHPGASGMIPGLERFTPPATPFLPNDGEVAGLPEARESEALRLDDGNTITLTATKVRRTIAGHPLALYGYNGQIPGPRIELPQGATITVRFHNETDLPSAVHWHGLRLENAADGVPGLTQPAVPPGGEFVYRVYAPDAGLFWYHPHHREDVAQDAGLSGNIVVRPPARGSGPREAFLVLDDLLLAEAGPVQYGRETATHALMGRFGNVLLVNGARGWRDSVVDGEVLRLNLTNAASARPFNLSVDGARLRVVGADGGRYAEPRVVESVVIAPSERYVVDLMPERAGPLALVNRVRGIDRLTGRFIAEVDTLGTILVHGGGRDGRPPNMEVGLPSAHPSREAGLPSAHPSYPAGGAAVPAVPAAPIKEISAELAAWKAKAAGAPVRTLVLTLRPPHLPFGLEQALRIDTGYVHPVEWTSTMPMMDWLSTAREVRWVVRDSATGQEGMAIDWRVHRGAPLVLRLINDRHVLHPMAHPIHLHGQRFLVLSRNGVPDRDPVWKDTVLVPAGGTVELLIDTDNPGRWMLHCHIAEHLEAGMHTVLTVE